MVRKYVLFGRTYQEKLDILKGFSNNGAYLMESPKEFLSKSRLPGEGEREFTDRALEMQIDWESSMPMHTKTSIQIGCLIDYLLDYRSLKTPYPQRLREALKSARYGGFFYLEEKDANGNGDFHKRLSREYASRGFEVQKISFGTDHEVAKKIEAFIRESSEKSLS